MNLKQNFLNVQQHTKNLTFYVSVKSSVLENNFFFKFH